jgi:hypothetical protein
VGLPLAAVDEAESRETESRRPRKLLLGKATPPCLGQPLRFASGAGGQQEGKGSEQSGAAVRMSSGVASVEGTGKGAGRGGGRRGKGGAAAVGGRGGRGDDGRG